MSNDTDKGIMLVEIQLDITDLKTQLKKIDKAIDHIGTAIQILAFMLLAVLYKLYELPSLHF